MAVDIVAVAVRPNKHWTPNRSRNIWRYEPYSLHNLGLLSQIDKLVWIF